MRLGGVLSPFVKNYQRGKNIGKLKFHIYFLEKKNRKKKEDEEKHVRKKNMEIMGGGGLCDKNGLRLFSEDRATTHV